MGQVLDVSASYIEEILDQIGFKYKRLDDSILNSDFTVMIGKSIKLMV